MTTRELTPTEHVVAGIVRLLSEYPWSITYVEHSSPSFATVHAELHADDQTGVQITVRGTRAVAS